VVQPQPETSAAPGAAAATRRLGLIYDLAVLAIIGSIMLFVFSGMDAAMYAAVAVGALVSFAIGYASLRQRRVALGPGTVRFGRLWVWMTLVAGLSLVDGKHEPMLFFGAVGAGMTLLYALGGWFGSRSHEPGAKR
jgi:hypothetical protein